MTAPAGPAPPRRPGRRLVRWSLILLLVTVVVANLLADRHAAALLQYAPTGDPPPKPESLSLADKLRLGVTGVPVPRPTNHADPSKVGLAFATFRVNLPNGEHVECWHADRPAAQGTVVLGHGYMAAKSSLLAEGRAFHDLGFAVLWLDLRGSGGSSRSDCTLGVREGEDLAVVVRHAEQTWPGRPVLVYGFSMGAAATLKAVAAHGITPAGVILEAPFDRMVNAVRVRVRTLGLPSWPAAELILFWGGRRSGIDGFAHNPADDAAAVTCPVLVLHGDADPRATPEMVAAVADRLAGPTRRVTFAGVGHEPGLQPAGDQWRAAVGRFADEHFR